MFCGVSWKFRHGCDIQDSVRQHCYSEILLEWLNRITETFAGNLLTQLCTYKRITGARYTIEQNFYWTPSIMEVVREHQYQGPQCSIPWWTFASKRGCRTYQASCCLGAGRAVPWDKAARCEADHSHQLPRLRYRYLYIFVYIYIYIYLYLCSQTCRDGVPRYSLTFYCTSSSLLWRNRNHASLGVHYSSDHWSVVLMCIMKLLSCYS